MAARRRRGAAPLTSPFDHDRDGTTDVRDLMVTRGNVGASLAPFGVPAAAGPVVLSVKAPERKNWEARLLL